MWLGVVAVFFSAYMIDIRFCEEHLVGVPGTHGPGWQQYKSACTECFPYAASRELMAECPLGGVCAAQVDTPCPESGLCAWPL